MQTQIKRLAALAVLAGWWPAVQAAELAGNVAVAGGTVVATAGDGTQRTLSDGDPLYSGDTLVTDAGSYADLDFLDGTQVVLHPGTSFQIQNYHYDAAQHDGTPVPPASAAAAAPQPENAFFRLLKGGLRILDGLIGQTRHDATALETPVATIGVRGTQYDARYCASDCGDEAEEQGAAPENGLYTAVQKGSIGVKNDAGETVMHEGEYGQVGDRRAPFRRLATAPRALRHMSLPERFKARAARMHRRLKALRQHRRMQRPGRLHGGPVRPTAPGPERTDQSAKPADDAQQKDSGKKDKKKKRRRHKDGGRH